MIWYGNFNSRSFWKERNFGHIDGTSKTPDDAKDLIAWETKDARIISWILGSMEAHMVNNLRVFTTAKVM